MPLLAYCITQAALPIVLSNFGVQEKKVETISEAGLSCFVSQYEPIASGGEQLIRESALAFNRVIHEIFNHTAVIPFRFPTLLESKAQILTFLRDHSTEYQKALSRLKDSIQMEMQISLREQENSANSGKESGSQYLKKRQVKHHKLEAAAQALRQSTVQHIQEWRQREAATGMRCYALITRAAKDRFLEQVQTATVPQDLMVRVTGPWPATEFLKLKINNAE